MAGPHRIPDVTTHLSEPRGERRLDGHPADDLVVDHRDPEHLRDRLPPTRSRGPRSMSLSRATYDFHAELGDRLDEEGAALRRELGVRSTRDDLVTRRQPAEGQRTHSTSMARRLAGRPDAHRRSSVRATPPHPADAGCRVLVNAAPDRPTRLVGRACNLRIHAEPSYGHETRSRAMTSTRDVEFRSYVLERRAAMVQTATLLTAGDRHLAEDVVQATLTRLYVAWPLFSKSGQPRRLRPPGAPQRAGRRVQAPVAASRAELDRGPGPSSAASRDRAASPATGCTMHCVTCLRGCAPRWSAATSSTSAWRTPLPR